MNHNQKYFSVKSTNKRAKNRKKDTKDYVILRKSSKANQIPGRQKLEKFHQLQQQIPTKEKSTLTQNISISVRGLNNPKGTRIAGKIQERCQLIS